MKQADRDFRFIIGIDLGTTQTALSYYDTKHPEAGIQVFKIPQLVSHNQIEEKEVLPSVVYINDDPSENPALPWESKPSFILGEYAKMLGLEIPQRLVHSSKSWLCHPRVNRLEAILPWQSDVVKLKISPVKAATLIIEYLRKAWDYKMLNGDYNNSFIRQKIIVTVPASFDPVARNLTIQAIQEAGVTNVCLLEEPQAAFYDFLSRNPETLAQELEGVRKVLVVDIGGGTTDFSLIGVEWKYYNSAPEFERLGVGPHLLIGGDNFDLAIAHYIEQKLKRKGKKLNSKQWMNLLHQSRMIKEKALLTKFDNETEKLKVSIAGVGSKVVCGTIVEEVTQDEIVNLIINGFFPDCSKDDKPSEDYSLGISEAGLPYCKDTAITKHLANFLAPYGYPPEAVLFNGGSMISTFLRDKILNLITNWREGSRPKELYNPSPILAVASGAVYYGMHELGLGHKIKSGNPVAIYLGVGKMQDLQKQNFIPEHVMLLMPKGAVVDKLYTIDNHTFGLDLSRDSAFYLFYSPVQELNEKVGQILDYSPKKHLPLPPMKLKGDSQLGFKHVKLQAVIKETGYLQIRCINTSNTNENVISSMSQSYDHQRIVKELFFDLSTTDKSNLLQKSIKTASMNISDETLSKVKARLEQLYTKKDGNTVFKDLEIIFGCKRERWDLQLLRTIFDLAIKYEIDFNDCDSAVNWLRLLGYTLRPGFGAPNDHFRIEQILKLFDIKLNIVNSYFWSEWWLFWKRVCPGLTRERQTELLKNIEVLLFPPKKHDRKSRNVEQHERNNLWRLLGHLERILVQEKVRLGNLIINNPLSYSKDCVALYALGRLGARVMAYATQSDIVHAEIANKWAEELYNRHHTSPSSYLEWALRELARKTSDRHTRIDDTLRKKIIEMFKKQNKKKSFIQPLLEVQTFSDYDYEQFFGENLPSGIVIISKNDKTLSDA